MEYRINVAKLEQHQGQMKYVYVFCTKQLGMYSAKRAYDEIKAKFPEPEYQVTFEVWNIVAARSMQLSILQKFNSQDSS